MSKTLFLIILFNLFFSFNLLAADSDREWRKVIDLRGQWKFSIGDNQNWSRTDYNDSDWGNIFAPANWEDEGYPGYDGYAWYRKKFKIDETKNLYIHLGIIDDVDQVFVNGMLIGFSGHNPPKYQSAYTFERIYQIPASILNTKSDNVIAIRVYDDQMEGGLVRGRLGIYENLTIPEMVKSLEGNWKFATGDDNERSEFNYNDSQWDNIIVPGSWEAQGYNYDGYGWYRLHFRLDPGLRNERLVMILGKIDDLDEAYLNGHFLGRTGRIYDNPRRIEFGNEWQELRAYEIDDDVLNFDGDNVIAVRVYDGWIRGGIIEGPVGLITYREYLSLERDKKKNRDFIFDFFQYLKGDRD